MLHLRRVPQAAAGPVHARGSGPPGTPFFHLAFFLLLWLAVPWSCEQRTLSCTTAPFPAMHFLTISSFFARPTDNLLLRLFCHSWVMHQFLLPWSSLPHSSTSLCHDGAYARPYTSSDIISGESFHWYWARKRRERKNEKIA